MSNILTQAKELIEGPRAVDYGDINASFGRISGLWSSYLGVDVSPHDVAYMMVLLKISRLRTTKDSADSRLDAIGYLLCSDQIL